MARVDHQHARAGDDPLLDGLLEPDVGVAGPLRAQVADGREAGQQHAPQVVGRPADAQGQRLLEHLVVPRRLVVRVQQDVRVSVDQARQQRASRQLDHRARPAAPSRRRQGRPPRSSRRGRRRPSPRGLPAAPSKTRAGRSTTGPAGGAGRSAGSFAAASAAGGGTGRVGGSPQPAARQRHAAADNQRNMAASVAAIGPGEVGMHGSRPYRTAGARRRGVYAPR